MSGPRELLFRHPDRLRKNSAGKRIALLSQKGSATRQGRARGGSAVRARRDAVLEPPPARSRLCLNGAAPLTQGGHRARLAFVRNPQKVSQT
jgi:hypothetical protein